MKVLSPLTRSEGVTFEESLDCNKIITQYKAEYAFDAMAYFENIGGVALYRCNKTRVQVFLSAKNGRR
jgi:hypothetical protein